jgi:hypothetical protein
MFLVTEDVLVDAVVAEEAELAAAGSFCEIAEIMSFSFTNTWCCR